MRKRSDGELEALKAAGADSVWVEPVMIPHWVRGDYRERRSNMSAVLQDGIDRSVRWEDLIGTPRDGVITGEVIEVRSFDDVEKARRAKDEVKIIFFNRPFDRNQGQHRRSIRGSSKSTDRSGAS
jgi:carboxypeptidase Q